MLEGIADKLKRRGHLQNRQLQTWLSEAAESGELDTLIEQQAQFGRRVTQKNK